MKLYKFIFSSLFITSQAVASENNNNDTVNNLDADPVFQYFEAELDDYEDNSNENSRVAQATDAEKPAGDAAVTAPADGTTPVEGEAPKKKVVKKIKKKKTDSESTMIEGATTGHGAQETGLPYKANVDLSLEYSSTSNTRKYKDNSYKTSESTLAFDISYLFVFGKFEVGPKLLFGSDKETSESADSSSGTTSTTTTTGSQLGLGVGLVFNFGNIHQSKTIPYVGADLNRISISSTSKPESGDETKTSASATDIGLEGGLKYFMGGHIALKPFFSYTMTMSGDYKTESPGSEALVASLTGSKLSLGVGLAKYF